MEITSEFTGQVLTLKYVERDVETFYSRGKTKRYILETTMRECRKGMANAKDVHRVNLLMNKVDYDNRIIQVGDKIRIKRAKWLQKTLKYRIYDEEKLKSLKGTSLKLDRSGNAYYETIVNSYIVNADEDDWEIKTKLEELKYATIPYSKVKFFITREDFNEDILVFFLEDDEFDKMKKYNEDIVEFMFWDGHNKIATKNVFVKIIEEKNQVILKEVK